MRQGQYQTPRQYQNPDDYHSGYAELPLDFLDQQVDFYPRDQGLHGLDHTLSKHLSLGSYANPGQSSTDGRSFHWSTSDDQNFQDDYRVRRTPRHSRSVSLGVESFNPAPAPEPYRRNVQSRQQFPNQGQHSNFNNVTGRGGRFGGPPFAGRSSSSQGPSQAQGTGRGEGERGQGYRKLWQQVTKVGRGQKLGENSEAVPFSDMTVEDLLRIVRNLPAEESAVQAVSRGLYYLDSRALAALLKELHKVGLSNRASELFDWLRGLAEGHELAHLCDVYTYTTIISQCGSHQQLRKALELVAEMRGRGISCNVHTYSALMNVCIKANELDLAIDVYGQLLREGCTPNLVTYNILIDVHGKTGNWSEAVKVLDALEEQGTKPEVRTYNTIINACNRSGQPEHALKVYERMIADGTQPTATTYTALISAYGKTGKVEEAMTIFQDMVARGCERNVITYSSLITACEKSGRYQLALDFFNEMHRDNVKPNVVTYNALIAACGQGGQWETAREIFQGMMPSGCKPDAITYGTLISVLDRGGQWGHALQAFEDMQSQGHRPDVGVFNTLIEVLSRSGSCPATLKAVQLFLAASRQGQFRMSPQGLSETTVIAFTVGAAVLATLHWIQDVRSRLSNSGSSTASPTSTTQQWTSPGTKANNALTSPSSVITSPGTTTPTGHDSPSASHSKDRASLLLLKGKQGRSESSPAAIEEAVSCLLLATSIPHAIAQTPQGVRVEVEVGGLQSWMDSSELEAVLAPLTLAASRKIATEELVREDILADERCKVAFTAVQTFEESHPFSGKGMTEEDQNLRREVVNLLTSLARQLGLVEQTVHDSVLLLDRLIRRGLGIRNLGTGVLLAAVALIAAQQGQNVALPSDAVLEAATGYQADQVKEMQDHVNSALDNDTRAISAVRVLHLYLERLLVNFEEAALTSRVAGEALTVITETIYEPALVNFKPSLVAAAVLYLSRKKIGAAPFWPQALMNLTGYDDPQAGNLKAAIDAASLLVPRQANASSLILEPSPIPQPASSPSLVSMSTPLSPGSLPQSLLGGAGRPLSGSQGQLYSSRSASGLRSSSTNGLISPDSGTSTAMQTSLDSVLLPRTPSLPSAGQSSSSVLQHAGSFTGKN